jgi:cell division protein FtsW
MNTAPVRPRTVELPQMKTRAAAGLHSLRLKVDLPLLMVVVTLMIFGLVMVYSASYDFSRFTHKGDPYFMINRQIMWLALGVVGLMVISFIDYHFYRRLVVPAMGVTLLLLVAVLVVNEVRNGAARTLLEGSVQPSEMAKLVLVMYLTVWLCSKRDQLHQLSFGLFPLGIMLGVLGGLIVMQPDLSAVLTIILLGGFLFFLAGGDIKQIFILGILMLIVGYCVVQLHPTGNERLTYYLSGLKDPTQGSYHVKRSFEAFVKGGWIGKGIGMAETKLTGLPVPPTDSIFAVIGEETGVVGAVSVVVLYVLLLWRGMLVARRAPDQMGSLLAAGLTLWITMEAFINMAVMVNLVPFAGNALPLISYGGSNLVMTLGAIGILLNISRLSEEKSEEEGRGSHAVVNLRGRDRRRRVSGAGGAASAKE